MNFAQGKDLVAIGFRHCQHGLIEVTLLPKDNRRSDSGGQRRRLDFGEKKLQIIGRISSFMGLVEKEMNQCVRGGSVAVFHRR